MAYVPVSDRTCFCLELAAMMLASAKAADSDDLREERILRAAWWHAMAGPIEIEPRLH